ncbi:MAG: ABC transporter permease [Chloroflexi bacterium]|nr:ABC transporter permease [Chloroflexota bacterium]
MLAPLTLANLKMILRNRQALFWALLFPLIFVTIFGLFRLDEPPTIDLLIVDHAEDEMSKALVTNLAKLERFKVDEREDEAKARRDLAGGQASYLLIIPKDLASEAMGRVGGEPVGIELLYDKSNPTASIIVGTIQRFVEEANRQITKSPLLLTVKPEAIQAKNLTYFDFLLPGFVGMGVMTYSIIGLSSAMALYREQKILKRMLATPLKVRTFFASQIIAFLVLSLIQAVIIMAAGILVFNGHVYGNFLYLLMLVIIANVVFLNIGFIVGAVAKNVRAADGMANAISMPMMFFSGTFFPKESLPGFLAKVVEYLPLAPLLDAMRGVALEARPFWDYPGELAILGAWIVLSSVVATRVFRFS